MSDLDDEKLKATRILNGVDKESDIEEDIKILKKIMEKYLKSCIILRTDTQVYINFTRKEEQAIKHILEEREQDKKKIKELEEQNKLILNSEIEVDLSYDDYISKQKIKELIENETINISGLECIAVEDIEELLKENK